MWIFLNKKKERKKITVTFYSLIVYLLNKSKEWKQFSLAAHGIGIVFKNKSVKQVKTSFPSISNTSPPDKSTWTLLFQPALCARQNSKNDTTDLPPCIGPSSGECGWNLWMWWHHSHEYVTLYGKGEIYNHMSPSMAEFSPAGGRRGSQRDSKHKKDSVGCCWFEGRGDKVMTGNAGSLQKLRVAPGWQSAGNRNRRTTTTTNCILPNTWKFKNEACPEPLNKSPTWLRPWVQPWAQHTAGPGWTSTELWANKWMC